MSLLDVLNHRVFISSTRSSSTRSNITRHDDDMREVRDWTSQ